MENPDDIEIRRSGLDHSHIIDPHQYAPRRVYGITGTDWEPRINFDRMRKERLARAKEAMERHDLGAMVLYTGANVRYLTGVYQGMWKYNIFIRYTVLCRGSEPVLFETVGADMERAKLNSPWMFGNIRPAITWQWSEGATERQVKNMVSSVVDLLKERKVFGEKVGVDMMDMWVHSAFEEAGVNLVNAWPAMSEARLIKTVDELECLKISSSITDSCFDMIRNEWLARPGLTESQLAGNIIKFFTDRGFEEGQAFCVASGGNTNPYARWWSDKPIRRGDLVITDIGGRGPGGGYYADVTRTHICGEDASPTPQEKKNYRETMDSVNAAIAASRPGNTSADTAKHFPIYDDDKYKTCSLFQFGHSIGLTLYEGMWISRGFSLEFPAEFKPNMYMAIETYGGKPGLEQAVRLEQNVVITEEGAVPFTLFPYDEKFLD